MSKHTPGPWQATSWEAKSGGTDWVVWGPKSPNHDYHSDLRGDFGSEADARLIAAAPDMYEALRELMDIVQHAIDQRTTADMDSFTLQPARLALAKAEGRS